MTLASRLHNLRAASMRAVDRSFSEPVLCSFLRSGRADGTRPAVQINAILRVGGGESRGVGQGADWRTQLVAGRAELHIDWGRYPSLRFVVGDKVRAIGRRGSPWFEVLKIDDREGHRLVLQLGEA